MKAEYATKQRALILEFLKENTAHVTATDILNHLQKQGVKIGVATVYRTLEKFVSDGILRKMVVDERSGACYQYIANDSCSAHFHLKCLSCGALIHLSCEFLTEMENHILNDHGFRVSSGKTVIYGTCKSCSENGK